MHSLAEDPCHRLLALLQALAQQPLQSAAPEEGCLPHAGPDAGVLPAVVAQEAEDKIRESMHRIAFGKKK